MNENEKFMMRAIELAKQGGQQDEVPVGAVVVLNGEIISEAFNQKEKLNQATRHAEMLAIEQAESKIGNWWLEDCELYVTLEPCQMCAYACVLSRLKKVWFGAKDLKTGACGTVFDVFKQNHNHHVECQGGILETECSELLTLFFKNKRDKRKNEKEQEKTKEE